MTVNIVFCEPSAQEVRFLHATLSRAFSVAFQDILLFGFLGGAEMSEYLSVSPDTPDIAMVSLGLKDMDSWALADWITEQCPGTRLVLTGAPPQDAEQLFAHGAAYFLYSPVREASAVRFAAQMETLVRKHARRYLELTTKRGSVHIAYENIMYVMSNKRKICVIQPNGLQDEAYKKLDEVEALLDGRFVRCHQSFLVNMDCIRGISNEGFSLIDNQFVPISQKRYWAAKRQYIRYIKSKG